MSWVTGRVVLSSLGHRKVNVSWMEGKWMVWSDRTVMGKRNCQWEREHPDAERAGAVQPGVPAVASQQPALVPNVPSTNFTS